MAFSPESLKDIAYECFKSTKLLAKVLYPDRFYLPFGANLHDKIFEVMDNDEIQKAVIAAPRGIGKTSIVNLVYPSKNILYRLRRYIVQVSCSERSAIEQSENLKNELITNPAVLSMFGNCKSNNWSKEEWIAEWYSTEGALEFMTKVLPRGAGQQIRGLLWGKYRPELLLIDDLEDPKHIDNDELRKEKKLWFFNDVMKSINLWDKKAKWRVIVLGSILHEECLIEELMNDKSWYSLRLEICDDNLHSNWQEALSDSDIAELWEDHVRQNIEDSFLRELRGIAVPRGHGSFKSTYFKYYNEVDENLNNNKNIESVILVDPAKTAKMESADSAVVGVGVNMESNAIFFRDCINGKLFPDQLMDAAFSMAERLGARVIGVETTGLENYILYPFENENVRRGHHFEILPLKAGRGKDRGEGKARRVGALLTFYRQGLVYHNRSCCQVLESQLLAFPKSRLWDVMDAFSYIIELLDTGFRFMLPELEESSDDIEEEYKDVVESTEPMLEFEPLI